MSIFEWLNENSGVVTAISTLAIAVFTIVAVVVTSAMAWMNRELVKENRILRKAGTEPEVAVYLKADSEKRRFRNLVLANVGQGAAKNVVFTILADRADFENHRVSSLLPTNSKIKGASFLPQGERIETLFGYSPTLLKGEDQLRPFKVDVSYENMKGVSMSTTYELDIDETKWISWADTC